MRLPAPLLRWLFPRPTRAFVLRFLAVGAAAWAFFSFVLLPARILGPSMEPAFRDGGFAFVRTWSYLFSSPKRGDAVAVRFFGRGKMLLKRVVALEGETVAFRGGRCVVDGRELDEPWVVFPCDWEVPPFKVSPGCVYVVGDNRSMPFSRHICGETPVGSVVGRPLFAGAF